MKSPSKADRVNADKPPAVLVRKLSIGLTPTSAYDFEALEGFPLDQLFELKPRARSRSNRQMRLYWSILRAVVDATDAWPTPKHLHERLKKACGYFTSVYDFDDGHEVIVADSIAFNAMTQDEFNAYFKKAMSVLSEYLGTDPLAIVS